MFKLKLIFFIFREPFYFAAIFISICLIQMKVVLPHRAVRHRTVSEIDGGQARQFNDRNQGGCLGVS